MIVQNNRRASKIRLRDEILSYIYSAVDYFGIGTHFKFNSGMKSATWDEASSSWNVETESGVVYNGKFLINCMGFLYKALLAICYIL